MAFCVWLLSLCRFSLFSRVVTCIITSFLSWPNNILLYEYTTFCLSIYLLVDIGFVSTLGLIRRNAILNRNTQSFMWTCFTLGLYLGVELLDQMVIFMFNFLENGQSVFQTTVPFSFLPAMYKNSNFSAFSLTHFFL